MLDNAYLRITNDFFHDMATGTWAACLLVLLVLRNQATSMAEEPAAAIHVAGEVVFWLMIGALAVIAITGTVRLSYWRAQTPVRDREAKRRALVFKHVVFAVIYGGGTWWGWALLQAI